MSFDCVTLSQEGKKLVFEMMYHVLSGTLNPTTGLPYHTL